MAVGKSKRVIKAGKKGSKKKVGDSFAKKEWYDVKAPAYFKVRDVAKTVCNRTIGQKSAESNLKGRIVEMNLADLNEDEDATSKKMSLIIEDVQGRKCLTDFHRMDITRDKYQGLFKKRQTLINAQADAKTTDGYVVRMFAMSFTDKVAGQLKSNCYAQTATAFKIRRAMVTTMKRETSAVSLRELVKKLIPDAIGREMEKRCKRFHALKDTLVWKVKLIRKPKFDLVKLMEVHTGEGDEAGADMVRPEDEEAKNLLTRDVDGADE